MLLSLKTIAISILVILEVISLSYSIKGEMFNMGNCCNESFYNNISNKTNSSSEMKRYERSSETGRGMMDHPEDHDVEKPKSKPWLGYYDFLITEGSYKFWVVFELITIAILVYSAFAALYYAKYTINDYENYDDYFFKRSLRSVPEIPTQTAFLGLPVETYLTIFNAIANYNNKYS